PRDGFEAIEEELLVNTYGAEIATDRRASLEADDRLELAGSRRSVLALREVSMARLVDDGDARIRRLAEEHDVPLEPVEVDFAAAVDRTLAQQAPELIASLSDLCFSDDHEIAVRALELAGRFSPH